MHTAYSIQATSKFLNERLTKHIQEWEHCTRCPLHATAHWRVLGKGVLPCDVLFVGEAPGNSENDTGNPFVGKCGKVLNSLIDHAKKRLWRTYKIRWDYIFAITNVVGCIPTQHPYKTSKAGYSFRKPKGPEIDACAPRLSQFTQLAAPRAIVLLGNIAIRFGQPTLRSLFPKERMPAFHETYHPSYLLRLGGVVAPQYKTWVADLTRFLSTVYNTKPNRA